MMKKIVTLSSQDVQIVKKKQIQDKVTLYLKKTTEIEICPYCGFPTTRTHGKVKTRTVMDKPTSLFKVELELIRRRWVCENPECEKRTFIERIPGIEPYQRRTHGFQEFIYELTLDMPIFSVRRRLYREYNTSLSVSTIFRDFARIGEEKLRERKEERKKGNFEKIGIDEFLKSRGRKFGLVLIDLVKNKILGLIEGKDLNAIRGIFQEINLSYVKVIVIDMWRGAKYAAKTLCPHAMVVVDRFHVMKEVNEKFNELLKRVRRRLKNKEKKKWLFRKRWVLLKGKEKLKDEERSFLYLFFTWNRELKDFWAFKEALRTIYEMKDFHLAKVGIDGWIERARNSYITELREVGWTLSRWREEILNFWLSGKLTNGKTESKVNQIKRIKRWRCGVKHLLNMDSFLARV
jgi:transposase